MIRQDRTTNWRWAVAAASCAMVAGSLLSLTAFTQRGGVGQATAVRGPSGEVWGFTDTAFNPNTRWRIHLPGTSQFFGSAWSCTTAPNCMAPRRRLQRPTCTPRTIRSCLCNCKGGRAFAIGTSGFAA